MRDMSMTAMMTGDSHVAEHITIDTTWKQMFIKWILMG